MNCPGTPRNWHNTTALESVSTPWIFSGATGGSVISHLDERSREPRQLNAINVRLVDAVLEDCYECISAYKGAIDDFPVERVLTAKIQKIDEVEVF